MSSRRPVLGAAALLAALLLPACRREPPSAPRRIAVLPFEDQSPSADQAWLARLLPFSLARQLEGTARIQVAEVRSATDLPSATHQISGFTIVRPDRIEAHLFLYELPSHKLVRHRILSHPPDRWRGLLEDSARFLAGAVSASAGLKPVAVHRESAARRLAEALSAISAAQSQAAFRAAAEADPACGWCWLGWTDTALRMGDRAQALAAIEAARPHAGSLDSISRSRLDLIAARLRSDPRAAIATLRNLVAAVPGDASAHASLSEALVANREFDGAVAALRRAIELEPQAGQFWNSLAYVHAYAGRFDEALKAVARYAQLDFSPNPADSRGEILMMAGRFPEAARAFEESYRKDPAFNNGAAMEKAALCRLLEGDSDNASSALARFLEDLAKRGDRAVDLRRARWEFLAGQSALARDRFSRIASDRTHPLAPIAASMFALRVAAADPRAASALLASQPQPRDPLQQIHAAYASAALDPASIERVRDDRLRAELRAMSLTVRRDWNAAAAAWQDVIERSPGGTDSPYRELRAFCLVSAGEPRKAEPVLGPGWPLLSPGQMEFLDFLVYPACLYTRAEIARSHGREEEARRLYDTFLLYAAGRPDLASQAARARAAARL